MRLLAIAFCALWFVGLAFAQSDRGTITGTVADTTKAVVPGASVVASNTETGAKYETVSTPTGNYTLPQLPAGVYELTVASSGFNNFVQQGIRVQVAQTDRIDIVLQVGTTTGSVTVTSDAPLLKTEGAEQSYNINVTRMNNLPLEFGARLRNPYSFANLVPGVKIVTSTSGTDDYRSDIRINGAASSSFGVRVDGQNSDDSGNQATGERSLPAVEAIEEVSVQTSNFAAEFGQVIGGLFNFTTRSGTNQYHGSAYDYITNEVLNAGVPFTNNGSGGLTRPRNRKQNFGFSAGGPVYIPKVYNGHGKTFFFSNYERFYQRAVYAGPFSTVPTDAFRRGDFSAALTGRTLATDPKGRPILENTIYDPLTAGLVSGLLVRDPFANNTIPQSRIDPVAAKIQALFPEPTRPGQTNNFAVVYPDNRDFDTTVVKIDHNLGTKSHLSFLYTLYRYTSFSHVVGDGLPDPISSRRVGYQRTHTFRVTDDYTLTPTLIIHLAVGMVHLYVPDSSPDAVLNYDTSQLGLVGAAGTGFPAISGLSGSQGGMVGVGMTTASLRWQDKPTAVVSATWVRDNHTYKIGAEWRKDIASSLNVPGRSGTFAFGAAETGLPSTQGQNLSGGSVGYGYASFLLGAVNSASISQPSSPQIRKMAWGLFLQDTWKVTRKLTFDYGLRWDYQPAPSYEHDRRSAFSPDIANPTAGGLLGATVYEGYGTGRCNCEFAPTYPYAVGPRLGLAYQVTPKTVFRAAWGIAYGSSPTLGQGTGRTDGVGWNSISFTTSSFGDPAMLLRNGLQYNPAALTAVNYNPGIRPSSAGQLDGPSALVDANGGRPPRVSQWNIGLQREITRDLVVEAAYVGNRGAWLQASSLRNLNALTLQRIQAAGLDINSAADRTLLTSRLDSATAISRGFGKAPYAGYPTSATVAQSLRPYPQFGNLTDQWAPLGNNWYDSLQMKLTKRYSHGLEVTTAFTWQKELARGVETGVNDVFNRATLKYFSSQSQPFVSQTAVRYETPALGRGRLVRLATQGWTVSGIMRYGSGLPILSPTANNNLSAILFQSTYANRVQGQPLFLVDPNCHCIDPNKQFVLNPKAWADTPAGQFGASAAYYNDYRWAHQADEQLDFGRKFSIGEKMSLSLRVEFFNAFNRTKLNAPTANNALATQSVNAQGVPISGFGYINSSSLFGQPRSGQFLARFEF
jgi:Carboxypeptidase regulatory-like domain/TonB-dependent Receptor Plug Domain